MSQSQDQNSVMLEERDRRYEERLADRDRLYEERDRRYEDRFQAQEKSVLTALAAAERAVLKAEASAEKRFESVNEFRSTLSDQQRNLMPRSEVALALQAVNEKVHAISEKAGLIQSQMEALRAERQGIRGGWGYAVGAVGIGVSLIAGFITLFRIMSAL